jgi:transcriptional regulator with XRE-family HTH domain
MPESPDHIGVRLRSARTAAGLSRHRLAVAIDVTGNTIQRWEAGENSPNSDRLLALAEALGVSVTWLLAGDTAEVA